MRRKIALAAALLAFGAGRGAEAASPLDSLGLTSATAARFANSMGIALDHRAYEPATSLSAQGKSLDLGLSITLTHLNDDFKQAMADLSGSSSFAFPFLPAVALNVHKAMAPNVDIGASYMNLPSGVLPFGLSMLGFDMKVMIWNQEESPTWALRLSYGQSTFTLPLGSMQFSYTDPVLGTFSTTGSATMTLNTWSWCPQVIVSRQLDWAEGYLGFGYRIPAAKTTVAVTFQPPYDQFNQTASQSGAAAGSLEASTGLSMRVPGLGLRITIEGWASTVNAIGLGTKLGMTF